MRYKEVPESHRSLLFKLVEISRATSSVLLPVEEVLTGLVVWPGEPEPPRQFLKCYTLRHLRDLEKVGYVTYESDEPVPRAYIGLMQGALDYYDYSRLPGWWRRAMNVWDKTETYWLSLLFGLIGGLIPRMIERIANLFN